LGGIGRFSWTRRNPLLWLLTPVRQDELTVGTTPDLPINMPTALPSRGPLVVKMLGAADRRRRARARSRMRRSEGHTRITTGGSGGVHQFFLLLGHNSFGAETIDSARARSVRGHHGMTGSSGTHHALIVGSASA
jgi:hypothetical protein